MENKNINCESCKNQETDINGHIEGSNQCVICGADIPEGSQVCVNCQDK